MAQELWAELVDLLVVQTYLAVDLLVEMICSVLPERWRMPWPQVTPVAR